MLWLLRWIPFSFFRIFVSHRPEARLAEGIVEGQLHGIHQSTTQTDVGQGDAITSVTNQQNVGQKKRAFFVKKEERD